jgi:hypothetical protein
LNLRLAKSILLHEQLTGELLSVSTVQLYLKVLAQQHSEQEEAA